MTSTSASRAGVIEIPSLEAIRGERARRKVEKARASLAAFVRLAWPQVDPAPLADGWYIDALAEHFQAVTEGQIRKLVVNIPPRYAKSTIGCVLWPAWAWLRDPSIGWLTASHSHSLAIRDAVKTRRLVESNWFRETFGITWTLREDQNAKGRYDTTEKGYRLVTSVESRVVGEGGDVKVLDDPIDPREAYSQAAIENANIWLKEVWSSRVNNPKTSRDVLIMQRIHDSDPSAELFKDPTYERLIIPQEYIPTVHVTGTGWKDPRTVPGELLCEARYGPAEVAAAKIALGTAYEGQHNQRPTPPGGRMIHLDWIRRYKGHPAAVAATCDALIQTWDCTFTDADTSDYVVGNVWGFRRADAFLLARVHDRLDFPATCEAIRQMSKGWPKAIGKYVENKANGPGIIASMRRDIPGLIAWPEKGSAFAGANKVARVNAVLELFKAGNIWIPEDEPWADEVQAEWLAFPKGHDDQVDAMTMALIIRYIERDEDASAIADSMAWGTMRVA